MTEHLRQPASVRAATCLLLMSVLATSLSGCSRRFWRQQAEQDSYRAISEKLTDERWELPRTSLTPDTRSRFYDPYDPDSAPLPPDDPAAHVFMHCSNGKEGYKGWHKYGDTQSVENPNWLVPYSGLLNSCDPTESHGEVDIPKVTLKDSIELTYIHSREYQTQLEDVYLRALTLTGERYVLGTRFHLGGPGLGGGLYSLRNNSSGTRQTLNSGIGLQQTLPGGAQLGVDLLNTITWNMGSHTGTASGLAWGLTQPLLNQAGRKIVLENLTQSERDLLYQVKTMARFRQTLFTDVASDYLQLQQQAQNIINRENNIRQLQEQIEAGQVVDSWMVNTVGEDLEALPAGALIPQSLSSKLKFKDGRLTWTGLMSDEEKAAILAISDDNSYQSAAQQLIRWRETQVESLGVLQLVTRLNSAQNQLEGARRQLNDQLDSFKIRLGLPPNANMTVDRTFLRPFELIDANLLMMADELKEFAKVQGPALIPAPRGGGAEERGAPDFNDLKTYITDLAALRDRLEKVALLGVRDDFVPVRNILQSTSGESLVNPDGRNFQSVEERNRVIRDVARDLRLYRINERDFQRWSRAIDLFEFLVQAEDEEKLIASLDSDGDGLIADAELPIGWKELPRSASTRQSTSMTGPQVIGTVRDAAIAIREKLLQISQSLQVVQAGLRVEAIALNPFTLPGRENTPDIDEVIEIGVENRLDLMNARAAVMDARRDVEIKANALKALLDLRVAGTADLKSGPGDDVNVSLDFKTPIDHVLQRNSYNQSQVNYQRARRAYMEQEDRVKQQIRSSWRQILVSQQRLEIDRQTVRNAAMQYDNVATGAGQNNNLSLLNALDAVLNAQNALVGDWITYETNRLNIFRDMGIMQIDSAGVWEDPFYLNDGQIESPPLPATTVLDPEQQSNVPPEQLPVNPPANGPAAEAALPVLENRDNE